MKINLASSSPVWFIARTVNCMNKMKEAFCLMVIRRSFQSNLFVQDQGNKLDEAVI
jgi:hypothetical protein